MNGPYRVVAIDFDGTLVEDGRLAPAARAALAAARRAGLTLVLVTGRTLAHLQAALPDATHLFDAVVAENGGVLAIHDHVRLLAAPPPASLATALAHRGIVLETGRVLLAAAAAHDADILAEVARFGLEMALIYNRGAVMVLPAGVTKATGLREALAALGLSPHNAVAVGDAENDHSLLEVCELGVAVPNAVESLKVHADRVLERGDGEGVAALLAELARGAPIGRSARWHVEVGRTADGVPVRVPASQVNVLITGSTGRGKSYLGGLFAERLIQLGYSLCVLDPEGDHGPLGQLPGVVTYGGALELPPPERLADALLHQLGSVVADLSTLSHEARRAYLFGAVAHLAELRARTGLPHWIFLDEAHVPLGSDRLACGFFPPEDKGYCLITFHPEELCPNAQGTIDLRLTALSRDGEASLALGSQLAQRFATGARLVSHVRHWHKYVAASVPPSRRFFFRTATRATGHSAGNLADFHRELLSLPAEVLRHHAGCHDFSRWVEGVLQDPLLAGALRATEKLLERDPDRVEEARAAFLDAVEDLYLEVPEALPA